MVSEKVISILEAPFPVLPYNFSSRKTVLILVEVQGTRQSDILVPTKRSSIALENVDVFAIQNVETSDILSVAQIGVNDVG